MHKPYVNKNSVRFTYRQLHDLVKTNRQLYYQAKKSNAKLEPNSYIKIGHLSNDYKPKVSRVKAKITLYKYIRTTKPENIAKAQQAKATKYLERKSQFTEALEMILKGEHFRGETVESTINGIKDVKLYNIGQFDIIKNALFRENLVSALYTNFDGAITDRALNTLIEKVLSLNVLELHNLSMDKTLDLITYIYNDPKQTEIRLQRVIDLLGQYSGKPMNIKASEIMAF